MEEGKMKYVIALGFYTNSGVTNDKCHTLESEYEIIHCYSVIFNLETNEVVDEYDKFIRPERNPFLSPECSALTGVNQIDVEEASEFYLFMVEYQQWLSLNKVDPYDNTNRNFVFATFGDCDLRDILPKQCMLQELEIPLYFDEWINVQKLFYAYTGITANDLRSTLVKASLPPLEPKLGLEEGRRIIEIIKYLLTQNVPIQITSVIDNEGNFREKEVKFARKVTKEVAKEPKDKHSLDRRGKRSKARGKLHLHPAPELPSNSLEAFLKRGKEILKD